MWQKGLGTKKVSLDEAREMARTLTLGGHTDWRVPTIKELYSLIDFRGNTGFSHQTGFNAAPSNAIPYINTDYFDFAYGNVEDGERYIDAQWLSSTEYVSTTMDGMDTLFGVNFADGRIKGYGYRKHGTSRILKKFYARFVQGNTYGGNHFIENGDGTVTDRSTGLTWMQMDSGHGMNWQTALAYAKNLKAAGYQDWRLPNAKELQSIVDYSRSPDTTGSPAIDPVFKTTAITNEAGQKDYPFFWRVGIMGNAYFIIEEQLRSNNLLQEVQRLKVIVQKLLLLSRADAGQLTLAKQRVDLSQLVAEIIEDITIIAPHLAIEHHLAQRITVTADPELLRQLVQNLGSNAVV